MELHTQAALKLYNENVNLYWRGPLGEFFRQYFFALDREELPFNRA